MRHALIFVAQVLQTGASKAHFDFQGGKIMNFNSSEKKSLSISTRFHFFFFILNKYLGRM